MPAKFYLFVFLLFLPQLVLSIPVIDHGPEDPTGTSDKTIIWRSNFTETNDSYLISVNILSADNNRNSDANGGMIQIVGGELSKVKELDFEYDCSNPNSFGYECYSINGDNVFRWFNSVNGNKDELQLVIRSPKNITSFIRIAEIGGMGCGSYYSDSQLLGGYPNLECALNKTYLGAKLASNLVESFPIDLAIVDGDIFPSDACSGTIKPIDIGDIELDAGLGILLIIIIVVGLHIAYANRISF